MEFPFSFNNKSSLLLIFFFHGIVFSFLLLKRGLVHQNSNNKWLSFLLFLCSMYITPYMLGYAGWYSPGITIEILFFVPFMQVLIIGPVVYFYIQSLLNPNFKFSKTDWFHFVPGFLYLGYSLVVFITDKFIFDEYYFYADRRDKDLKTWYQLLGLTSMIYYLILSLKKYLSYKKLIFDVVSYADSILFRWIQNFLLAFLSLLIFRVIFFFSNFQWEEFGSHFWYFICFSFVFFYISISGYSQALKSSVSLVTTIEDTDILEKTEVEKFKLDQKEIEKWKGDIISLLENEKIFENPQLTLSEVSSKLQTTSKNISMSINHGFDMNFNDLINHYRIEAVKQKIQNKEHLTTTLLGIAFDSGFNSKATFNRAFKKDTAMTPKAYIESLK